MCQPEAHWFLKQKIPLFHPLKIWITKTMCVISNVSYSIQLVEKCYCRYCSLIIYDFIWLVSLFLFVQSILTACSRIPVNKGTKPMVDEKMGSLYQVLHPSCDLDTLCVLAGANVSENQKEKRSWNLTSLGRMGNKTREKYLYIRCCILIRFILSYLESKGKIDIHQYRSHTCLQ